MPKVIAGPLPAALEKLRRHTLESLNVSLVRLFEAADDWLFDQANESKDASMQRQYLDMMRMVRLQRSSVEKCFLQKISEAFRQLPNSMVASASAPKVVVDNLSLIGHEDMEQNVALSSMAQRCKMNIDLPLKMLGKRLEALLPRVNVNDKNNPLEPSLICEALGYAVTQCEWEIKSRLIFYKLFQRYVLVNYHNVVADGNQLLVEEGVLRQLSHGDVFQADAKGSSSSQSRYDETSVVSDSQSGNVELDALVSMEKLCHLQQGSHSGLLSGALTAFRYADVAGVAHRCIGSTDLNAVPIQMPELLGLIHHLQQQVKIEDSKPLQPFQVINDLEQLVVARATNESPEYVDNADVDVLNLVSKLFDVILNDEKLPQRAKALLGRLQIPYLKVAVADVSFLNSPTHPARLLVNELADAGVGLSNDGDGESDTVFAEIKSVVKTIINDFTDDLRLFEQLLSDFRAFIKLEERRAEMVRQRLTALEEGKARSDKARQEVSDALQAIIADKPLPQAMVNLIEQPWYAYLCWVYHKQGKGSRDWVKALYTVQQMLFCLEPVESSEQAEDRQDMISDVLEVIGKGCECIAFSHLELSAWLQTINDIFRKNARFEPVVDTEPLSVSEADVIDIEELVEFLDEAVPEPAEPEKINHAAEQAERLKAPRIPVSPVANNVTRLDITKKISPTSNRQLPSLPEDDAGLLKAQQLVVGAWLEYKLESDIQRCKLAAHIKSVDKMIFVNRSGVKLFEKNLLEVAYDINDGKLLAMDDSHLFDRALENVINSLRDVRSGT